MNGPSIRKPLGVLFILALIGVWGCVIMALSPWIATLWWPVQAVVYLVAGVAWIAPLGPVLRWMER
jgi:hypothetical protein